MNQIPKDISRSDRRQLVVVSHNDNGRSGKVDRIEKVPRQRNIHHGKFIDDKHVGVDRIVAVLGKGLAVIAKQAMDGGSGATAHFLESLGRFACRGGQHHLQIAFFTYRVDDRYCVALTRSGTTGDQADGVLQSGVNRIELFFVERFRLTKNQLL